MDGPKTDRQPHLFSAADGGAVLAMAGLWDVWRDTVTGDEVPSCTIIVSGASAWMTPYHDRMPVLLGADDFGSWLSGDATSRMLRPAAEAALREWIVSQRVNKTGFGDDDPSLLDPVNGVV